MAEPPSDEPQAQQSRLSAVTDAVLATRAALPVAVLLLLAALAFCAYAVHSYLGETCYESLHEAKLDGEIVAMFDTVEDRLIGLRKGTGYISKWSNREFQDALKEALHLLADGRQSLENREPFAVFADLVDIERRVAKAKALATNRVNFILAHQDPKDYDAFEKYRLEGKDLVAIVKELDAILETFDNRTKKLPGSCDW